MLSVLALLLASCGSDDDSSDSSETSETSEAEGTTETSDAEGTTETSEAETDPEGDSAAIPERIVSLSPSATEVLFAIGAGDQVVAVDSFSNYPPEAPTTDISAFEPNLEAIAGEDPDLVVASDDRAEAITDLDVDFVIQAAPADLDGLYNQIVELGILTGHEAEAEALVDSMSAQVDEIIMAQPERELPVSVYHELDETMYSITSNTFIGQTYALLGLINIADEAEPGVDYPQLSAEYVIESNPAVMVITNQGGYTPEDVAARPGWEAIDAVANGNVIEVDADIASRWGPRIVDFMQTIGDATAGVQSS